ncbi:MULTISPECIES: aldo/keto reductase [unclassified Arthrobacter]|uniref:aldo/keto reductase n=1 Tax=unclassified Arthrobacter TaxID=235627 RepID=UPI001D135A71|nr:MULTISPECIES: aldo/keto reductase [unclassified Arthrobacter]MCC3275444.1 aldo/keto reductase [Arthrobacter sp. zg-Y20]MCC9176885.1 aldo/keto reductase [Arthrobacter sp. zg-Y750]MDK1315601.1 aldo/keto reductase [Arthrobacter sp. zg.Y20]WIB06016.1 aldo/keto reductase [Arthrobacter sp. zg-Y20]
MRTTTLGTNGPEVGVIGLGCMGMSYAYDMEAKREEETSISVIRGAIELGATLIDTADVYGPYTNEELVGRALKDGYRERAVLSTKVGLEVSNAAPAAGTMPGLVKNGSPDHIRQSIDASLRRLGTDHVDLYILHRVDPEVPLEDSWGAMAQTVRDGKARAIGISEASVEEIKRAQSVHPVTAVQSELSLWTRDRLADVVPYCVENGLAFLPFSPLGRGFLTGRFTSFDQLPPDDMRRRLPRFQQENLMANLAIVQRVRDVAERVGATPAQVALAWVVAQGQRVIPIPGTKTPKYLRDNVAAGDLVLSDEDLAMLDNAPQPEGSRY